MAKKTKYTPANTLLSRIRARLSRRRLIKVTVKAHKRRGKRIPAMTYYRVAKNSKPAA